jgi:hypothetical protein
MSDSRTRLPGAGVSLMVIHPGMVRSEEAGRTAAIVKAVAGGEPVRVMGSPCVRRPLVHVDDLAEPYLRACSGAAAGRDLFGVAEDVRAGGARAAGQARSQRVATDLARHLFGWGPTRPFRLLARCAVGRFVDPATAP